MKLFEPGRIGSLTIKNRIVMAPMSIGGLMESDGRLAQQTIDLYLARARGGTGLITTAAVRVTREIESLRIVTGVRHLMADSVIYTGRFNQLAEFAHDYGAKVCVQMTAGQGRVVGSEFLKEGTPIGPSALDCYWNKKFTTRELTIKEIERLIDSFAFAADMLRTADIDAVELHGHEGYLMDQFKTSLWNKRTDKYGGSLEGRMRFSIGIIEAVKKGAGKDFPVVYRFGLRHDLPGGREIEEGLKVAKILEQAGADALHVDAGCYETWYWPHPPTTQPPGCMVDMAAAVKKVAKIPVIAVGKLGYPALAEKVLQEGKADFICLGRPLLADPEWPNKVKTGQVEDICPCIGDHECLGRARLRKYLGCTVNPLVGYERELVVTPAPVKKKVLVIGGGPGGMEAARTAALRGHSVTLWEKNDRLGGNLLAAAAPDFKDDYKALIRFLERQLQKTGVKVELGKEARTASVKAARTDVIFVATGSTTCVPNVPGIKSQRVVTAVDVLLGKAKTGQCCVVVGGGSAGCETALFLARQGKKVTLTEIADGVMRDMHASNRLHLLKLMAEAGVTVMTQAGLARIDDEGITIANKDGKETTLPCDTVVLAMGMKPNDRLLNALRDAAPEVYAIGDCVKPRKVIDAMWEGYRTARLA